MKELKHLTVNGVDYRVTDPTAARIDDEKIGENAWSAKQIVDMLCPAFSESGSVVTCRPVAGYPLEVVSQIKPVQEGEGDPSPGNVRPISGLTAVTLQRNGEAFTAELGQEVYGGSLNWATGVLTVDWAKTVFDGTESAWIIYSKNSTQYDTFVNTSCFYYSQLPKQKGYKNLLCNAFNNKGTNAAFLAATATSGLISGHPSNAYIYFAWGEAGQTLDEWKAFLAQQYAKGTPVAVVYELAEPITVQLTPQEIAALSGENVLSSDTGEITVSGRLDLPAWLEGRLSNA